MRLRNVVLVAAVLMAGGGLALEFAARAAAVRLARTLEPSATLSYESAGIALNGSIRLSSPRLKFNRGPLKIGLQARVAHLRGPGRFWLVGQALSGDPIWPADMSLITRGLTIEETAEPVISSWASIPELVLFENLGCGSDALTGKDRVRMGMTPEERVDIFAYRYEQATQQLELSLSLNSENVARWNGTAAFTAFDPTRWSDTASRQALRLASATLSYQDPGYLTRRNKFCADWLGITPAQFVDRHVAAVRTFLATHGIDPSEDVLGLYQRMVNRGGALNLASLPDASWVPAETDAYPRQVLLRLLNITVRIDDAPPIMLRLAFMDPEQPLYVPTSALPDPALADVLVTDEPAHVVYPPLEQPAAEPSADPPPAPLANTAPAVAVESGVGGAGDSGNGTSPPPLETAAEVASAEQSMRASAPPPPENSTLALVWKPGQIERLPPPKPKAADYDVIATASLGSYPGKRVQLLTTGGKLVDGDVRSVESDTLVLIVQVGRGSAELNVPLGNIREARLVRPRQSESR